jgi:hypothetical protein
MRTHLIIPDQHVHPDHNNKRFEWLGKLILDIKPDVVINLGDLADMPSLCSYDKGTTGFEGRRYKNDIKCVVDAQERMFSVIKKAKRKLPEFILCLGNHEDRISRAISSESILDGTISIEDLNYSTFGWKVVPYLEPIVIDRIAYSHYFTSGVMGRSIGGENPAKTLIKKHHMSVTQGHSHTLDFSTDTNASGERMMGLVGGCYLDYKSDWNNPQSENLWWSGVIVKHNVSNGCYDPQFISFNSILKEYS